VGGDATQSILWECSECDPENIFLTSKFELLLSKPTHKTETGTAYKWETTNSNPPGPIIYLANHKQGVIDKNDLRVFRERESKYYFTFRCRLYEYS